MHPVDSEEYKGFRITFYQDEDAESPRDWDNLGRMVCWHKRYYLGDCDRRGVCSAEDGTTFADPDDFHQWWKANGRGGILISLYLYDHSGITMSAAPFSCPWDSGQVGYIYVTRERMLREYGGKIVTAKTRERARACLLGEVETYDQFLTGDVYGYVIQETGGDREDSCWGFFGIDSVREEARAIVDSLAADRHSAQLIEEQYS